MKKLITRSIGLYLNSLAYLFPQLAGKQGFELFCRPFRPQLKPKHLRFLHSADRFEFQHADNRIQGYRWGDEGQQNILLLHGWQSHSYWWKPYVEFLRKKGYTCYAFDAPGHGLSSGNFLSVPLYSEIVEHMLKRTGNVNAVIGHSLGSFTSMYTFHRLKDLPVAKLIALAPPAEAMEFFRFFQHTLQLSGRSLQAIVNHFNARFQRSPEYFSAPAFVRSVDIPGLIIHDQGDEETPLENSLRINEAWEQSTLVVTEGLGHHLKGLIVLEHVEAFLAASQ